MRRTGLAIAAESCTLAADCTASKLPIDNSKGTARISMATLLGFPDGASTLP